MKLTSLFWWNFLLLLLTGMFFCFKCIYENHLEMHFSRMNFSRLPTRLLSCLSAFSSRANIVSRDGATIICWHPRQNIPYEKTKPIIRDLERIKQPESPLKVQFDHTKEPTIREVAAALCKSSRTLKPRRKERSFSPYYWDDEILRRRL